MPAGRGSRARCDRSWGPLRVPSFVFWQPATGWDVSGGGARSAPLAVARHVTVHVHHGLASAHHLLTCVPHSPAVGHHLATLVGHLRFAQLLPPFAHLLAGVVHGLPGVASPLPALAHLFSSTTGRVGNEWY